MKFFLLVVCILGSILAANAEITIYNREAFISSAKATPCLKFVGFTYSSTKAQVDFEEVTVNFFEIGELEKVQWFIEDWNGTVLREYDGVSDKEGNIYLFEHEECRDRSFWAPILKVIWEDDSQESQFPPESDLYPPEKVASRIWDYVNSRSKEKEIVAE